MGIKKHLKATDWKYVGAAVAKRRQEGKDSVVFIYGKRIPDDKVRRETQRQGFEPTFERLKRRESCLYALL